MLDNLGDATFIVQVVVAFGAGVISFVSPCVLPLMPGYLSMMSGYSATQLDAGDVSTRRMLRVIALFIGGFTLVFAALGAAATSFGQLLRANIGVLTRVSGVIIIVFGLLMAALAISDRGPLASLSRERRIHVRPSRLGKWAPPAMGAAFAFGWSACIGPVLTVILGLAAVQETVGRGIFLLVFYSLGLGLPFLLAGLGMFKLFGRLKPHLRTINVVSGLLLAAFGVVMVTGNIGVISSWLVNVFDTVPFLRELTSI